MDSTFFQYILPVLKFSGLLAATFFGIAEHFNKRDKSKESERRKRKWGIVAILISFIIASGSELIETISKRQEAIDSAKAAERAARNAERIINDVNRTLHPIFPISINITIEFRLDSPIFHSYRSSLIKKLPEDDEFAFTNHTKYFPDKNKFPDAYALLTTSPRATLFIKKHGFGKIHETNLSFRLDITDINKLSKNKLLDIQKSNNQLEYEMTFEHNIWVTYPTTVITNQNSFSDGEIMSTLDLLNADLEIEIMPFNYIRNTRFNNQMGNAVFLSFVTLTFPGRPDIFIESEKVTKFTEHGMGTKHRYLYRFPKTFQEWNKTAL
ncbi:hypothetical protein SNE25_26270 [Mucilaginibacter sabulilitoris]|uniref:Uncharacterized protein n=1 Tax=Mucilaginibacter sabulilitoris TaxID=1173583 RepID=A0ABZ0TI36_9SPHI|nr:hypothetical protein [Mucilaginibacter sabulilitoris]WPU92834.1 hypothetical protein SNE25_26270 [Mucilaginibacter sabulilitoris]